MIQMISHALLRSHNSLTILGGLVQVVMVLGMMSLIPHSPIICVLTPIRNKLPVVVNQSQVLVVWQYSRAILVVKQLTNSILILSMIVPWQLIVHWISHQVLVILVVSSTEYHSNLISVVSVINIARLKLLIIIH